VDKTRSSLCVDAYHVMSLIRISDIISLLLPHPRNQLLFGFTSCICSINHPLSVHGITPTLNINEYDVVDQPQHSATQWLPHRKASLSHRQQNRAMPLRPFTALLFQPASHGPSSSEGFLEAADKVGRPRCA
jgi:hypothetical protein